MGRVETPAPALEADRPDFTEGIATVPPGWIQSEAGYTFSRADRNTSHSIGELLKELSQETSTLVKQELALARACGANIDGARTEAFLAACARSGTCSSPGNRPQPRPWRSRSTSPGTASSDANLKRANQLSAGRRPR